jgi:hypothetical protein
MHNVFRLSVSFSVYAYHFCFWEANKEKNRRIFKVDWLYGVIVNIKNHVCDLPVVGVKSV